MTFPVVETRNVSAETSAISTNLDHTVILPSGISAGELVIFAAVLDNYSDAGTPATLSTGWTKFIDATTGGATGQDHRLIAGWHDASGGETNTTFTYGGLSRSCHASFRISGAASPSIQPPESSLDGGSGSSPDPPSLTPTGGAKDYLWIAFATQDDNIGTNMSSGPTNYLNFQTINDTSDATIASAERQLNASSENPGTFTAGSSAKWGAVTLAIHPSGAGQTVTPSPLSVSPVIVVPNFLIGSGFGVTHKIGVP